MPIITKTEIDHSELRLKDSSFDYKDADTAWGAHGFHPYPAMMIYPIARRLLLEYSREGETVLDPFMGSGTVLVESLLNCRNAYGIDINPLALLIAKVKSTPLKTRVLRNILQDVLYSSPNTKIPKPDFFNIDFWFKDEVINQLVLLSSNIKSIDDEDIKRFFEVAFSETVRISSNTRTGEFKLLKIKNSEKHKPDVLNIFKKIVLRNINKMSETYSSTPQTWIKILDADSRNPIELIDQKSIDLVLTSPPYGDSRTTVAYGQFSRLSLQWLGYEEVNIDKKSLGGITVGNIDNELPSPTLQNTLNEIYSKDEKRAREVLSFYLDLDKCLFNIRCTLKLGGFLLIVIGNRRVKKVTIPTDIIISELCDKIGFNHLETFIREIPTKRMPKVNSPTNIAGEVESTMNHEYIIILEKVGGHGI